MDSVLPEMPVPSSHPCECLVGKLDTAYCPSFVVNMRDPSEDVKPCGAPATKFTDYGRADGRVWQCSVHHALASRQIGLRVKREFSGLGS